MQDTRKPKIRKFTPREPVAVQATRVSQLTCLSLLGIDPRRFLDLVVPRCTGVAHVGRLRVVALDDAERAIETLVAAGADEAGATSVADDDGPQDVDALLRTLGRRRVAGGAA